MRSLLWMAVIAVGCSSPSPGSTPLSDASEPLPPDAGPVPADAGSSEAREDAGMPDGGTMTSPPDAGTSSVVDPFAAQPDESEGLVDVSADLEALLERGALDGACQAYQADPSDRRKMLLCGKQMFFYESFGTGGIPAPIVDFLIESFPDDVGLGFEQMGMVPDPSSPLGRPLGFAPGDPLGSVETLVWTCAACHFGQLPDGRYAVGAPNHRYQYGKQILALSLLPQTVSPMFDPSSHHPRALQAIQPMIDRLQAERALRVRLLFDLLPLLFSGGASAPAMTMETEGHYASWPPGTMDFMIAPLPLDDQVHTVSKIIPLWGLPRADEQERAGMPHALLAWTGGARSLESFLEGFVQIGGGPSEAWPPERMRPLAEYIYSLRAPTSTSSPDRATVSRGRALFEERGCLTCHGAPRGSGDRVYTFEEIGTDDAMRAWGDPDLDGEYCCGFSDGSGDGATHGIKSPRLTGIWSFGRFLHNGALDSLEALFCTEGPRPANADHALGTGGHQDLCDDLSPSEKDALIRFLRSI